MAAFTSNVDVKMDVKPSISANVDRLKLLYPMVNEEETPLPRSWSPKDKFNYIGLSQNNLRVHYKGHGKTHKDAASVRATHPIPPSCGLYYFEVKIVSKGRDGYMGIGLSAQDVNMNRLPGWDKHSYGYHGDDGHSFCSSGTGQPYGPTFTTGDVIGCGVNLIDNTCFYTKNGHHLGTAFTDLPPNLYPTVGLQTPGEIVDANFGQAPFVFNIEDIIMELKQNCQNTILNYPMHNLPGDPQDVLQHMVSSYLVHHGYCVTAQAFAKDTHQAFDEEITSIINRQKILKLVLAGRLGEAIETTSRLYPGLLSVNPNLLFLLKVSISLFLIPIPNLYPTVGLQTPGEIVDANFGQAPFVFNIEDIIMELKQNCQNTILNYPMHNLPGNKIRKISKHHSNDSNGLSTNSHTNSNKTPSSTNFTSNNHHSHDAPPDDEMGAPLIIEDLQVSLPPPSSQKKHGSQARKECDVTNGSGGDNSYSNGITISSQHTNGKHSNSIDMNDINNSNFGTIYTNDSDVEQISVCPLCNGDEEMDVDPPKRQLCGGSKPAIERMLEFGRELYLFSEQLRKEQGKNEENQKMLQTFKKYSGFQEF
ncbi:ran-binding protein 9-like [Diaphorina citri]|uniref:Ran-binding protein 9-like n=1 Tax=Diaphorina citri TaxID=121845 RepID=A0A3Q0JDL7_DIACI|nr:ran-binding protein 9-like [Diaphorina citri]